MRNCPGRVFFTVRCAQDQGGVQRESECELEGEKGTAVHAKKREGKDECRIRVAMCDVENDCGDS